MSRGGMPGVDGVVPIVLVGGRSRRFGRDKLREPIEGDAGACWLVDRPIGVLREVFGPRVAVVGRCDPAVAGRADLEIQDRYPGVGPIGGILSALESCGRAVFVLPGDTPNVAAGLVRAILDAAGGHPEAMAVLAEACPAGASAVRGDGSGCPAVEARRVEPCIGLYRPAAAGELARRLGEGSSRLHDALPRGRVVGVGADPALLANVNRPEQAPGRAAAEPGEIRSGPAPR